MMEASVCYMGETNLKKNEQKEAIYRKHNIKLTKRQRLSWMFQIHVPGNSVTPEFKGDIMFKFYDFVCIV